MLGSVWNFVKRHKKKFIFTGVLVGGVWALGKYAKKRILDFQEREAEECLAHARRQHHFDSNQRTCNMTVLSMLPGLREAVNQALDSDVLTQQLKSKPANKLEIWEELKIISFSRSVTAVYSVCCLISLLRVQLNIVGGYMYLDSMVHRPEENDDKLQASPRVQQRYLATVQYLLGKGLEDMISAVKEEVTKAVGSLSLKQQVSLADVQNIVQSIRNGMEYQQTNGYHDSGASSLVAYMMPPDEPCGQTTCRDDILLRKLQLETQEMLQCNDFHSVMTCLLDGAFERLVDLFAEYYKPTLQESGEIRSPNDIAMPLAKVVPIANGLLHTICADAPNAFVQELLLKEHVKNFAANIYEAFSQAEEAGAVGGGSTIQ